MDTKTTTSLPPTGAIVDAPPVMQTPHPTRIRPRVVVASIHNGEQVAWSWHRSLVDMLAYDGRNGRYVIDVHGLKIGTGRLSEGRNAVAEEFLSSNATWLLWLDTDAGFAPDTLDRLLSVADEKERPIVGALTYSYATEITDGMGGYVPRIWPVIMDWREDESGDLRMTGYWPRLDYAMDTVVECDATGSHCVLIHRSVLAEIGPQPYDPLLAPDGVRTLSEDLAFCRRAKDKGFPIHVHTGVKTTHMKPFWVGEQMYIHQQLITHLSEKASKDGQAEADS